jgi:caa(3)-type oxidase subunit IV
MTAHAQRPNYFVVWLMLVGLVIVSIAAGTVLSKTAALVLIFAVATVKAALVILNYMHLKYEKPLIYALVLIPLLIVIVLMFALFPDFVFHGHNGNGN